MSYPTKSEDRMNRLVIIRQMTGVLIGKDYYLPDMMFSGEVEIACEDDYAFAKLMSTVRPMTRTERRIMTGKLNPNKKPSL